MYGLRQTYHRLRNRLGHTKWYIKVMKLKWKLDSVCLEIVLILAEDRCMVCAERTIDSEIILDAPDGKLLGDVGLVHSPSVHSEMVLVLM